MSEITSDQLERVAIIVEAMGQRGNIIAQTLAQSLLSEATPLARKQAFRVTYAMLVQLSSEFKRITRKVPKPLPRHYPLLEVSARELARKGNALARGLVKAIESSPAKRDVILLVGHAYIFQVLVGIEMALTSTRSPAAVSAALNGGREVVTA